MSQKRKAQRARHEEEQKKTGEKVVMCIFGVIFILAVLTCILLAQS